MYRVVVLAVVAMFALTTANQEEKEGRLSRLRNRIDVYDVEGSTNTEKKLQGLFDSSAIDQHYHHTSHRGEHHLQQSEQLRKLSTKSAKSEPKSSKSTKNREFPESRAFSMSMEWSMSYDMSI